MLHIYYGDGKGKTTAAVGLALRAIANDVETYFFQFMKSGSSGEILALGQHANIEIIVPDKFFGFTKDMTEEQKQIMGEEYIGFCKRAMELMVIKQPAKRLVILDEALNAVSKGLLEEKLLVDLANNLPENVELVFTGRECNIQALIEKADYITRMKKEKHPFDKGIRARKGIEY